MFDDADRATGRRSFGLVIPTHRRPELVLQAVDSALRQIRPFDRVIVVPDGLDDPAIEALAGVPVELVPIVHAGVAAARNAGLARATTDWVCFLDDDDLLHPDYLARVEQAVEVVPERAALSTWYWSFAETSGPDDEITGRTLDDCLAAAADAVPRRDMSYLDIEGRSFDLLLERLRGSMSTAAVRRDVLVLAGGFPNGMTTAEDWVMYVNVARLTEWHTIAERLAFFRDHAGTNTRTGSPANGLTTLRAIRSFWEPSELPTPPHRPLDAYRTEYRHVLGWALAAAAAHRDAASYREALELARAVLPRRSDRLRASVPGSVRDRLRRARRLTSKRGDR
ncbi:glycosyltransferase family 2 protein [Agromyces sp. NPDC055661]